MLRNHKLAEIELTDQTIARLIGHRVRLARKLASLSQVRAGEVMGVTFQQVQKYELGNNRISPAKLARLSRATGRSMGWFFDDVTAPAGSREVDIVHQLATDAEFAELVENWRQLGPSARSTAMQTTRLLAELTATIARGRAA